MVNMNRLSPEKRSSVIAALVEGNSIRATVRMTGVAKNTVTKLLTDMGVVCSALMDREMRDLPCERIQVDEIWAFVGCKEKNVPDERRGEFGVGDVWTWVALDADTSSSRPTSSDHATSTTPRHSWATCGSGSPTAFS